ADGLEKAFVSHVHGGRNDDLVPGSEKAQRGGEERILSAGGHHHLFRIHLHAGGLLMPPCDGGTQMGFATDRGIAGSAGVKRLDCLLDRRRRRGKIGVALTQENDVVASVTALPGLNMNIPGPRTFACDALYQWGKSHEKYPSPDCSPLRCPKRQA